MRLLEAIRASGVPARFYQASSSEMFGSAPPPQNEQTPFHPRSPYGVAKVYAYWATVNYRESYGMFASNGILFNHESPAPRRELRDPQDHQGGRRDPRRQAGASCTSATSTPRRDWGFAGDYVEAMWRMLQHDQPDDFVIATGEAHIRCASSARPRSATSDSTTSKYVVVDARYFRPAEVDYLLGDPTKAQAELGWVPTTTFDELVR